MLLVLSGTKEICRFVLWTTYVGLLVSPQSALVFVTNVASSIIQSLTPSAIAAVLLSAPKDPVYDYYGVYTALRRYLSTETRERFEYSAHGYFRGNLRSQELMASILPGSFFTPSV